MAIKKTTETISIISGETLVYAYKRRAKKGSKIDRFMRSVILESLKNGPYPGLMATVTLEYTRKWGPLGLHTVKVIDVKPTMGI